MKVRKTLAMLLLMLALAGCKQQQVKETQQITIDQAFDRLVIISQVGDITIQSGDDTANDVGVTAEKFANGCTKDQAQQYLDQVEVTCAVDNNTCTITVQVPENKPHYVYGGANLTITGVQGMPLDIDLDVGAIECDTMSGGSITNNVGDITVAAATGDIEIETDTGDIKVLDYSGSTFSLRTDVGTAGIHISDNGTLDGSITTGVGDISCEISKNRSAGVELQTGVGNISITGITDYALSGFISLRASFELGAADGNLTMETGTGDIAVNVF
jgi:DUF4097 and DUF4098 domain-containing protein YvlB